MTMPPERTRVRCPKCGETYDDWIRHVSVDGSHSFTREEFDAEYVDEAASATCPSCKTKVYYDDLKDGEFGVVPGRSDT